MTTSVALCLPETPDFDHALRALVGEPPEWLRPALPYSAIAENCATRPVALIGVRFDFTSVKGRKMSVIHFADTLRNPEKTEFTPHALRFFCAEPEYATFLQHGSGAPGIRAQMNLQNLRTMLNVRVSVDCFAFDDGRFEGPDTGGAFERFRAQRAAEQSMVGAILAGEIREPDLIAELNSNDSARRMLAAKLMAALGEGGHAAMLDCARNHRLRIDLFRPEVQ